MLLHYKLIYILLLIMLTLAPSFVHCQSNAKNNFGLNITILYSEQNDSLAIPVQQKIKYISIEDIKTLPYHTIQLQNHKTKKDIIWEGTYLYDVFEKYLNINKQKIYRLLTKAPDGYSSLISDIRMSETKNALCAFNIKGEGKWKKNFGYMRIIFPNMHEMHWVNNPHEIKLYLKDNPEKNNIWKFHFFNSSTFKEIKKDLSNNMHYWFIRDILDKLTNSENQFTIFTQDGNIREFASDSITQKMKMYIEADSCMKISGSKIPIGYRLRNIYFLASKNNGLFLKSLHTEDQKIWQSQFSKINPFFNQGIKASSIILILNSGEKFPTKKLVDYQTEKISLFQLMQIEKNAHTNLRNIIVDWQF